MRTVGSYEAKTHLPRERNISLHGLTIREMTEEGRR